MRLLFVINPVSGAGQKDWQVVINEWLNRQEHTGDFFVMRQESDNTALLTEQIDRFQPDRLVVVGGDGTVKMAAEVLIGKNIPLAILPAGSANGMARELGIPFAPVKALELSVHGKPSPLDMIKINGEWCIHLSDIGLNAKMLRYFNKSGQRGMIGYFKAVIKSWGRHFFMRVTITTDQQQVERKAMMVVIANASRYGTGAVINPTGKTDDGLFELVIVRRLRFGTLLNMLIMGRSFDPANIEILRCRSMQLTTTHAYPFQVDGESRDKQTFITATIEPAAVKVVMG